MDNTNIISFLSFLLSMCFMMMVSNKDKILLKNLLYLFDEEFHIPRITNCHVKVYSIFVTLKKVLKT